MLNKFNNYFWQHCLVAPTDSGICGMCSHIHFNFFSQFPYQAKFLMDLLITSISLPLFQLRLLNRSPIPNSCIRWQNSFGVLCVIISMALIIEFAIPCNTLLFVLVCSYFKDPSSFTSVLSHFPFKDTCCGVVLNNV